MKLVSLLVGIIFVISGVMSLFDETSPLSLLERVFGFIVCLGFALFSFLTFVPLKKVSIENGLLYVSNYFRETTIDLAQVKHVSGFGWLITIHLKYKTRIGRRIRFMAHTGLIVRFEYPIINELNNLIKNPPAR